MGDAGPFSVLGLMANPGRKWFSIHWNAIAFEKSESREKK
jgi:hypothetical protein